MTSSSNDDREALVQALMGPRVIRAAFGTWKLVTHEAEAFADAILAEFLPDHDERVKAEAWDEGLLVGQDPYGFDTTDNPYRRES